MVREYSTKAACLLMLMGFAFGIIAQAELLKPGVFFLNASLYAQLIAVHSWATSLSLVAICALTLTSIRHRTTLGQWGVWLGFSAIPLVLGGAFHLTVVNAGRDTFFSDTVYSTACFHAYGTVVLMVALGGLSAMKRLSLENMSTKLSFTFAPLIALLGGIYAFLQSILGLNGMPRRYVDYPDEFSPLQFFSSVTAIICLSLSIIYVILLWRHKSKGTSKIEEVF